MALGKPRTNKRSSSSSSSSSSSYTSTITTIVVIALCVLGVWMLTSENVITPPQSTSRTSITSEEGTNEKTTTTLNNKQNDNKGNQAGAFEDNPGELPDDALKSDEPQKTQPPDESNATTSAEEKNEKQESTTTTVGEEDPQGKAASSSSSGAVEENNAQGNLEGKETAEEEQEKQNEQEIQVSEESTSTVTQSQSLQKQSSADNSANEGDNKKNENSGGQQQEKAEESRNSDQDIMQSKSEDSTKQFSDDNEQGKQQEHENQKDGKQKQEEQAESNQDEDKTVTFSDETNQEQITAKPEDEEAITKDNNLQTKPVGGGQEMKSTGSLEESKQDSQDQESSSTSTQETKQEDTIIIMQSTDDKPGGGGDANLLPNSGIPKESTESKKSWATQAAQSNKEKERRKDKSITGNGINGSIYGYTWQLCNVTAGPDYIPCLDNEEALKHLRTTKHYEHRERHCPEDPPTCLIPLPEGYKTPILWPTSRDKIWFQNVPHPQLAEVKGHQNWVKVSGEFLTFPGGGTQFIHGALHYIDFIQQSVPAIAWGKHTRVILDVGCGVASFGGYLFDRDVLTMSFAPKDEHEAQVQFALERGIPAISAVMGTQRLPFPSGVFDLVHCARCRVPWHEEGGRLLLELNRVLRPGGHFVWSATPVYQKLEEDVEIWEAMSSLTASMCWKLETIQKDKINQIGAAIYRKPSNNQCYEQRKQNNPQMCKNDDDPNAAWNVPLQPCMHRVPVDQTQRGNKWPIRWAKRLRMPPYWLNQSQMGIYGKPAPNDFITDYEHWKQVVNKSYLTGLGISWKNVRNVMDMRAVYGGFAAALRDLQVWVLNVVNVNAPDTLPIIYERGLFGIYHDWCEGFSTYPRTYDLLHADHLFSRLKERCKLAPVMAEIDRIVRPGGKLIVRDDSISIGEVENLLKSLHWEVHLTFSKDQEGILSAQKSSWRPETNVVS